MNVPDKVGEAILLSSADDSIILRPTMKYDLFEFMFLAAGSGTDFDSFGGSEKVLSEEGLKIQRFAGEKMSDKLIRGIRHYIMLDGALLATDDGKWPQCVMWKCPVTNSVKDLTEYVRSIKDTDIRWMPEELKTGIVRHREEIAEVIEEFWDEIFYEYYSSLHPRLVRRCEEAMREVDSILRERFSNIGMLEFMENWSGHKSGGISHIVLYPHPFRIEGAYALIEPDEPFGSSVWIFKPVDSWITIPLHEFSHILLRDVFDSREFGDVAERIKPTDSDKGYLHMYRNMAGIVEEYCVSAFDILLQVKAGFIKEDEALKHQYYQTALCLELTSYLLKNHILGEDVGETMLKFLRSKTK